MRLSYHRLVQAEANEAVRWYEEQSPGLGEAFFARLSEVLETISARPESFGFWLASKTVRRVRLKRFPYTVLFEIRTDRVRVLCLRHNKRHPSYGLRRG